MSTVSQIVLRIDFWAVLGGLAVILLLVARRQRLRWRPAWLLRLALAALILILLFAPRGDATGGSLVARQVLVVDQSDSLSPETRLQAWQQAVEWQAGGEARMLVVYGAASQVVIPAQAADPLAASPPAGLDGRAGDLPAALQLAADLLDGSQLAQSEVEGSEGDAPALSVGEGNGDVSSQRSAANEAGRVILVSDGLADPSAAAAAAIERLARSGYRLDAIRLDPRPAAGDLAVGAPLAPANLWSGTGFSLLVPILGIGQIAPERLHLAINGEPSAIPAEAAGPGGYRFELANLPEGIVTLQVTLDPDPSDPFPQNNSSATTLRVFPAPRVLFVSADPGAAPAARLVGQLSANGIQVQTALPAQLPTGLDQLQAFRVIFLDNLLSSELNREQMTAVQIFVSRLAGGLVVLGGRNSYTLGGYSGTLIEPMLPVKLEPPPRSERPPLVFQLILDRSASMSTSVDRDISPIALAREAAMRSIETLRPEDTLGLLTFSDQYTWDFPLAQIGGAAGMRLALDAVSRVQANGGTYMFQALQQALASMSVLPPDAPRNRHILLLTDGQSTDGDVEGFRLLAETAREQGITISTIAVGSDADVALLEIIAEAGEGRFYLVQDAADLPRILIAESQAARSENVQLGRTSLKAGEPSHPTLSGIGQDQLPLLSGYNALTSKAPEGAEDVLLSTTFDDPLLSFWQYGLGRVGAWTTDIGGEWMESWPQAEAEGAFWTQVVRYALPNPALGPAQVNVQVEATQIVVEAALYDDAGEPLNLVDAVFTFADPQQGNRSFRLAQTAPGLYRLTLPRPPDGAYRAIVSYNGPDGLIVEAPAPFAVNPPPEWRPPQPEAGAGNLAAWTAAAGGELLALDSLSQPAEAPQPLTAFAGKVVLQALLAALVLLWPVEIAIRRRWLPWS